MQYWVQSRFKAECVSVGVWLGRGVGTEFYGHQPTDDEFQGLANKTKNSKRFGQKCRVTGSEIIGKFRASRGRRKLHENLLRRLQNLHPKRVVRLVMIFCKLHLTARLPNLSQIRKMDFK